MRNGEIDRITSTPERDNVANAEKHDSRHVCPFGALAKGIRDKPRFSETKTNLWTISEGTDHDEEQEGNVQLQDDVEDLDTNTSSEERRH